VGWVVMQVAAIFFPALHLPAWTVTLVAVLLIMGFPLAVCLAWLYEITPEGIRRDRGEAEEIDAARTASARRLDMLTLGALVLVAGLVLWDRVFQPAEMTPMPMPAEVTPTLETEPSAVPSVAVLPFVNMSPDPENAYFADGVAEEVLNVLAGIAGLRVVSRTSSFTFRGEAFDVAEIGARLGVAHVVEGSVRRHNHRVRVTAQLIDAESDQHLWSETYDRQLEDIFAIQQEIGQAIADALGEALGVRRVTVQRPTEDFEAYELYLRGRELFRQRGRALLAARSLLEQALERDPEFASAWALLASIHYVTPGYVEQEEREDRVELATDAVAQALALDPELPRAVAVQGLLLADKGDRVQGLVLAQRAVELDPNDATGWLWLGLSQLEAGYLQAARESFERARRLDPLSGIHALYLGGVLSQLGDRVAATEVLEEALAADLAVRSAIRRAQIWMALHDGLGPEAAAALERYQQEGRLVPEGLHWALGALAAAARDEMRAEQAEAEIQAVIREYPGESWAEALLALGLYPEALAEALRHDAPNLSKWRFAVWHPRNRPFRELPGFLELAERDGWLAVWNEFGYPDFCRLIERPVRRLECTQ
jgi:adenylate cyclase